MRLIGQRADYCFFVASQVFGNLHPDIGTGVSINARLMEAGATVPYLAACVWDQVREIHQRVVVVAVSLFVFTSTSMWAPV